MADYAEGLTDAPPPLLLKVFRCDRHGVLPRGGGLDDQPIYFPQMETISYIYAAVVSKRHAENMAQWVTENPGYAGVCGEVDRMRRELDA